MDYSRLGVRDFLREARGGRVDFGDFYSRLFERVGVLQKKHNFFVTVCRRGALSQLPPGKGRLQGLPVSVKDNICTAGLQTTAGSRILEGYKPPFDATAIEKVKRVGGVVIGKTQQDEFGFGTFSTNSGFGVPKNPIDPSRSCGGSSGGGAGLVRALEFPHVSLAESTGGSISCPASFCGVVGITPTYGLVSRWGLIDYSSSLDKIGVLARNVGDAALLLGEIQGFDSNDFTSLNTLKKGYGKLEGAEGLRVGVPKEYFTGVNRHIQEEAWKAVKELESQGARVKEVSLPNTKFALAAYYIIATSEASTNLARYCGMRYGASIKPGEPADQYFSLVRTRYLGKEAKRRVLLGTFARMAGYRGRFYLKALKVRSLVIRDFERVFRGRGAVDVLVAPTMPCIAPKFSEIAKMNPATQYAMDRLTVGPSLAGVPHLSVPFGKLKGMPVGVHLIGDHLQERKVLRAGKALEGT